LVQKTLVIPEVYENQSVYLLFEAANQVTSLYINGKQVGKDHLEGYATFAQDITSFVQPGANEISGMPVCTPFRGALITGQRLITNWMFMNDSLM
jgi:beta-galactosidase/beta-glucuronidase